MSHRKRSRGEFEADHQQGPRGSLGIGETLSRLNGDHIAGNQTPESSASPLKSSDGAVDGWQDVETKSAKRARKKRAKEEMKRHESSQKGGKASTYPSITHAAHARLASPVKVTDLQQLILYLTTDGTAPQWVAVGHRSQLRKVVVLMVPGIELGMFDGTVPLFDARAPGYDQTYVDLLSNGPPPGGQTGLITAATTAAFHEAKHRSPDDFYPRPLAEAEVPSPLKPLARIFPHIWPIQCPGDGRTCRMYSPLTSVLNVALPKNQEDQQQRGVKPAREAKSWQDRLTPIDKYISSADDLLENDYIVHESLLPDDESKRAEREKRQKNEQTAEHCWVDTGSVMTPQGTVPPNATQAPTTEAQGHLDKPPPASLPQNQEKQPLVTSPSNLPPITLTSIPDPLTASRPILALDCEMCLTSPTRTELTRISILSWTGDVLLDTLVKPPNPITDYLTAYSGITADKLANITTTIQEVQRVVLDFITIHPDTILVGHSLNSDLAALKLVHPHIVDTTFLYPHPGGNHLKSSLKWLSQKYLSRNIQQGGGSGGGGKGHDSIEDARAALDLVKQKCKRGPSWGTTEATQESIFRRIQRTPRTGASDGSKRTGGLVDFGVPRRGHGAAADVCVGCRSDDEVVEGVRKVVVGDADAGAGVEGVPPGGVDFTWARLRELEAVRGFWAESKTPDVDALRGEALQRASAAARVEVPKLVDVPSGEPSAPSEIEQLHAATARTVAHVERIWEALPPCTAFVVYSGSGDPREMRRLQGVQQKYKKEYRTKKWDEIDVKWSEKEEQELRRAYTKARNGVGFITVK